MISWNSTYLFQANVGLLSISTSPREPDAVTVGTTLKYNNTFQKLCIVNICRK